MTAPEVAVTIGAGPAWPRCATWARGVALDPGGTAPRVDDFVLVEHPLPWQRDVGKDPVIAAVEQAVRGRAAPGRRVRVQALAVDRFAPMRRVVLLSAGDGPFRGYGRVEAAGSPDDLPLIAAELVVGHVPPPTTGAAADVLICTHGARDTCCGSLGTRLWRGSGRSPAQVWRTSHTGGHRFAPTAITFPDGAYWAHLDRELLAGIVDRSVPADVAARHLRGCAAFTPVAQVADRAAFAAYGWGWLATARFGDERSPRRVEMCFEQPDGRHGSVHVCLSPGRRVPVPDCQGDPAAATKVDQEWRVVRVETWD